MNRVFITGGAGYVGAVMVPHLLEKGFEVTVLDLMIYGEHVLQRHDNLNAVKGDIRDQDLLKMRVCDVSTLMRLTSLLASLMITDLNIGLKKR